jgi:hypothetical protein
MRLRRKKAPQSNLSETSGSRRHQRRSEQPPLFLTGLRIELEALRETLLQVFDENAYFSRQPSAGGPYR